jgi:WD40 repeat protein
LEIDMRFCPFALLLLVTGGSLAAAQQPDIDPKDVPGKPILAVNQGGHLEAIVDFDFTADGQRLFTLGLDNTIQIWDAVSGEHLKTLPYTRMFSTASALPRAASNIPF